MALKFARFNGGRTALIVGAGAPQVLDVAASLGALPPGPREAIARVLPGDGAGDWSAMIAAWDEVRGAFEALAALATSNAAGLALHPLGDVTLEAPLPSRERRIFSLGANTVKHLVAASSRLGQKLAEEDMTRPKAAGALPIGFNVLPDSVVGPDVTILAPAFVKKLDYEGECAIVVQSEGRNQGRNTRIWGYSAWNDYGVRDGHLGLMPVTPAIGYSMNLWKNFDTANVFGPWVLVGDGLDLDHLRCRVLVNGEERQDWTLDEMIYDFHDTLDHLSQYMSLKPGDIVTSGTGAGAAMESPIDSDRWLKPGDVVEVLLDGIDPLVSTIGAWAA